jgi:hypothetical protein
MRGGFNFHMIIYCKSKDHTWLSVDPVKSLRTTSVGGDVSETLTEYPNPVVEVDAL